MKCALKPMRRPGSTPLSFAARVQNPHGNVPAYRLRRLPHTTNIAPVNIEKIPINPAGIPFMPERLPFPLLRMPCLPQPHPFPLQRNPCIHAKKPCFPMQNALIPVENAFNPDQHDVCAGKLASGAGGTYGAPRGMLMDGTLYLWREPGVLFLGSLFCDIKLENGRHRQNRINVLFYCGSEVVKPELDFLAQANLYDVKEACCFSPETDCTVII